jgi:signal transduction histidine kinase
VTALQGEGDEEALLRSVLYQNAESIFLARQRAERDLEVAREALEARTTELATALSMMQATLEATADGIMATDQQGRVTAFNEKFLRMWSLPADIAAAGDHGQLLDRIAAQLPDAAGHRGAVEQIVRESPQESFDVLELADGRVFERYTRVQTVRDRAVGRVWSYRDVTDRARAVAQLREAKSEAEAASRAKSAFLAVMSHELRTPLNAIAGYAQILEMGIHGGLGDQQRDSLARIQASQRHLLTLIDAVLLHAKLETGTIGFDLAPVPAGEVMAHAEALVAPQAWSRELTIVVRPCDPGLAVCADRGKLQQILVNLLSNAVKFTNAGGASRWRPPPVRTASSSRCGTPASASPPTSSRRSSSRSCRSAPS